MNNVQVGDIIRVLRSGLHLKLPKKVVGVIGLNTGHKYVWVEGVQGSISSEDISLLEKGKNNFMEDNYSNPGISTIVKGKENHFSPVSIKEHDQRISLQELRKIL